MIGDYKEEWREKSAQRMNKWCNDVETGWPDQGEGLFETSETCSVCWLRGQDERRVNI